MLHAQVNVVHGVRYLFDSRKALEMIKFLIVKDGAVIAQDISVAAALVSVPH
jgi:hypothetical protein